MNESLNPEDYSHLSPRLAVGDSEPDRNLALELVRVTEAAAIAGGAWIATGTRTEPTGPPWTPCAPCWTP